MPFLLLLMLVISVLPAFRTVAGIRAGAVRCIPADGGGYVLDTVVVRSRVHGRAAVAAAVAG